MRVKYLIIGAGPAGLGAAWRLLESGERDFIIVESSSEVGGLARSFLDKQGFTWDIGGHVQFSHYQYFDTVMDRALGKDGWINHQRTSSVWLSDRFIPYPFQNNIGFLPSKKAFQCLRGLKRVSNRKETKKPGNFKEWIIDSFGKEIATTFMLPYNHKVWSYPAEELDYQWIGERVSTVDFKRIARNVLFGLEDSNWGPNNMFRFPKRGGTGSIWQGVSDLLGKDRILLNNALVSIDPALREALMSDGTKISYQATFSSMPLDVLCKTVRDLPDFMASAGSRLKSSSVHVVGFGIAGRPNSELTKNCWMYFPDASEPFYRVTLFSKYSPHNVPGNGQYYSLMTEVSRLPGEEIDQSKLIESVKTSLHRIGLIGRDDKVVSTFYFQARHGYPTPSLERDQILNRIVPELQRQHIFSRGRFGGWKYEVSNQDHTFMQGVEWANLMLHGTSEKTYALCMQQNDPISFKQAV